jgi:hypothetical protein
MRRGLVGQVAPPANRLGGTLRANFILGYKSCRKTIKEEGSRGWVFHEERFGRIVDGVCIKRGKNNKNVEFLTKNEDIR